MALGLACAEALGSPLTTDQLPHLLYLGTPVVLHSGWNRPSAFWPRSSVHSGWFAHSNDCTSQLLLTASCSVRPRLSLCMQRVSGTPLMPALLTGGLEHRAAWRMCCPPHIQTPSGLAPPGPRPHTHTQGLISPTLFSGTFTAGMGADTRWGLICPGALGAPHTMHYRWEGAQGGSAAPAEACVLGGGGEEEVPQPRPTVGGADTGLRWRGGGRGTKCLFQRG